MNRADFIAEAIKHAPKLWSLLGNYHPVSAEHAREWGERRMKITAAAAEDACGEIREQIKQDEADKGHPIARFDAALQSGDAEEVFSLLNSAWFGVPESTECWRVPGFREAVALLEDPPEE